MRHSGEGRNPEDINRTQTLETATCDRNHCLDSGLRRNDDKGGNDDAPPKQKRATRLGQPSSKSVADVSAA